MIVKIIQKLKSSYDDWRERRFLRKHGCVNREQYNLKYDPLHNPRATRLVDYYHGYKYIYCFENHEHDKISLLTVITLWCLEENLSGKWRLDVHRVIKQTGLNNNGNEFPEYFINDIGGGTDYIFAAFNNERDYMLFLLRWS